MYGYGIKETTTTTGTGTLTLSAVTGFPRFSNKFADGQLACYSILDASGLPIECGIGTYTASNTLARTYPTVTWDGTTYDDTDPTAFSLAAGTKTVICTGIPAGQFPFLPQVNSAVDSNKTMGPGQNAYQTSSGFAFVANTVYLMPFRFDGLRPPTAFAWRISVAAAAGKLLRVGLYQVKVDGQFGARLAQSTLIAADTTGVQTAAISGLWLPPGWYATAMVSDGAPTINGSASFHNATPFGVDGSNIQNQYATRAIGSTTLPDPWSGALTGVGTGTVPGVYLRT